MRTTFLIAATAAAVLGLSAFAANGGPNTATSIPAASAASATTQDQTPNPGTSVCPNGCTPGSGYGRGYCGGRGMGGGMGMGRGAMMGRGMHQGPQDGTGPRRDGSCMGS